MLKPPVHRAFYTVYRTILKPPVHRALYTVYRTILKPPVQFSNKLLTLTVILTFRFPGRSLKKFTAYVALVFKMLNKA